MFSRKLLTLNKAAPTRFNEKFVDAHATPFCTGLALESAMVLESQSKELVDLVSHQVQALHHC